jgi:hypothetical protein
VFCPSCRCGNTPPGHRHLAAAARSSAVIHIITGKSDDEQHGDGDFTAKDERYSRAVLGKPGVRLGGSPETFGGL